MRLRCTPYNQLAALCLIAISLCPVGYNSSINSFGSIRSQSKAFADPVKAVAEQKPSGSPVEGNALSKIYQYISRREYHISYDKAAGAWQSPNRTQNIRAYYSPGHWKLQNRRDSAGHNWKLDITTLGIYAGGAVLATTSTAPQVTANDNSIEFTHAHFSEQYINTEEGVRQNFIITAAPAETKMVEVKLRVRGMKVELQSDSSVVLSGNGQKLTYSGLKAWDADGKGIKAAIEADHQTLSLVAYTVGARFPVTIDPIIANGNPANAAAMVESNQVGAQFSNSVSGAGDVNGDGYSDVIVGATYYDNGQTDEGAAFVYYGSSTGVSTTAAAMVESNKASALLGFSVSGAGDVNGDGYNDIIVGAYQYSNGQSSEGAFYVYHGSASGISTTAAAMVESNQATAYLGISVSGAGDVNGDGYSDVIVGAYAYDNGQTDEGVAFVYHGSATGISTTAAAMVESNQAGAILGASVSGAGDVNGDGYSDVIVGAYYYDNGQFREGAAFVYQGSSTGISTTAAAMVESNQASTFLGYSVSGAGDVNGDGYSDVIVGPTGITTVRQLKGLLLFIMALLQVSAPRPLLWWKATRPAPTLAVAYLGREM